MTTYSITGLTEQQMVAIARACEFFLRVRLGQFREVAHVFSDRGDEIGWEDIRLLEEQLSGLAPLVTRMPVHGSFGITHAAVGNRAQIAYEVYSLIDLFLKQERHGDDRYDRTPLKLSTEPLPIISRQD